MVKIASGSSEGRISRTQNNSFNKKPISLKLSAVALVNAVAFQKPLLGGRPIFRQIAPADREVLVAISDPAGADINASRNPVAFDQDVVQ